MKDLSDSQLIEEYTKNKSSEAFKEIYSRYVDFVFRFIYSRTGNVQLTEDIVSDTFLTLIDVLKNFEQKSKLQTFIIGISFNKLRSHWNNIKKQNSTNLEEIEEFIMDEVTEDETKSKSFNRNELEKEVKDLLNTLSGNYKDVLVCRFLENLSVKNTAIKLNITEANVRVLQNRALKKLKNVTH